MMEMIARSYLTWLNYCAFKKRHFRAISPVGSPALPVQCISCDRNVPLTGRQKILKSPSGNVSGLFHSCIGHRCCARLSSLPGGIKSCCEHAQLTACALCDAMWRSGYVSLTKRLIQHYTPCVSSASHNALCS